MKYAQKAESELQDRQESSLKIESEIWILKALEDKFDSYGITNERMNEHRLAFLELLAEQKNKEWLNFHFTLFRTTDEVYAEVEKILKPLQQ